MIFFLVSFVKSLPEKNIRDFYFVTPKANNFQVSFRFVHTETNQKSNFWLLIFNSKHL